MQIRTARAPGDLRAFIDLPYRIYKHDPNWVAPLRSEIKAQLDPKRNPFLDHCIYALFLLEDGGKVIGRVAAFVDTIAVDYWGEPIGLFGYFECPASQKGATMLLEAARDWLQEKGMRAMRGPWSFVSQEWGMVIEGFTPAPCIMSPYNPPFYNDQMTGFGLKKIKDLLVYEADAAKGHRIPERLLRLTDRVTRRTGITVRYMDMKDFDAEVDRILSLANGSVGDNWGYSPVTEAEIQAMARDLRPVICPKCVVIAEDQSGQAIGFGMAIPDVNVLLKGMNGRLWPFGWARLMWGLPRLKRFRMFALGVVPEYQGKAVDALIYRAIYEAHYSPDAYMEINYVLEDNAPMNNAILKMGATHLRRYRIYQMAI